GADQRNGPPPGAAREGEAGRRRGRPLRHGRTLGRDLRSGGRGRSAGAHGKRPRVRSGPLVDRRQHRGSRPRTGDAAGQNAAADVFCEIVAGAPHNEVYRDELVVAFLDRAPLMPGHTLVITREHFATLEDVPSELLAPFFGVVQRISKVFGPALGAEGTLVAI